MKATKKLIALAREHYPLTLAILIGTLVIIGWIALSRQAEIEADARKSPESLLFEKNPDPWLSNQQNVREFRRALDAGGLSLVALDEAYPGLILYTRNDGLKASTVLPDCSLSGCPGTALQKLSEQSAQSGFNLVRVHIDPRTGSRRLLDLMQTLLSPFLLMGTLAGALLIGIKLQTGSGGAASKLVVASDARFDDAIGNEEAKAALNRVKAFLHDPGNYARLGATAPRGVLLIGPPGTGKTLLARGLAGESKANFIAVDGSYFTSMFYGAGVSKVKELFKLARLKAPCVLFIDEIDGIGKRTRGGDRGGNESELNRIINRVLVEMDGFDPLENVVVVAATNHEENLDEAMRRPGRFDMLVRLSLPTLPERERLFELYIRKVAHDGSADTSVLARMTAGMSPAEIANVVNKAASTAAELQAQYVTAEHVLQAIEAFQLGGEVSPAKSLFTQDLRERLAYHEAGHALVGHWLKAGTVERVTIEPRGQALGVTYITRDTEDPLYKQAELTSRLAMMLAGRETELLVFDSVSSGASDDLKRASELAINMVASLGFSDAFGLLSVAGVPKELLGPDIQAAVLAEARALLSTGQAVSRRLLQAHRTQLDALARRLLEREVLSGEELRMLLDPSLAPAQELSLSPVRQSAGRSSPGRARAVPALCLDHPIVES
jgi:cell division protease FtsH